jgi:hypothetical protein
MFRLGFIPALLVLVVAGCGGRGSVSQKDVQKQFEAIQSLAAEGALVADGAADGRTTDSFVRVHSSYLDRAADKVANNLASARAGGVADRARARGARLAAEVADRLATLGDEPDDRSAARRIATQLRVDAALAERLAG